VDHGRCPGTGSLSVAFTLPRESFVQLSLLDAQGRRIAGLASGRFPAGLNTVTTDTRSGRWSRPAGIYFVRLEVEDRALTRKIVLLR
jgi:hypothetical protein